MSCYDVEDGSWRICKLSLRTGTIIIGLLDVLYAIIRGVSASVPLSEYEKNGLSFFNCIVLIVILLLALLELIAALALLWGVRNRLPSKIQLWVPTQKVLLVLYLLIYIVMFVLGFHWLDMIYLIIFHPIIIYFIPVVSSYAASQNETF